MVLHRLRGCMPDLSGDLRLYAFWSETLEMKCNRCRGILTEDHDPYGKPDGLRCINCGERYNQGGIFMKKEKGDLVFKIEKGIPIPPRFIELLFPFDRMDVEDSFLLPDAKVANRCRNSRTRFQKRDGKKEFITRKLPDGKQYRCWRVK